MTADTPVNGPGCLALSAYTGRAPAEGDSTIWEYCGCVGSDWPCRVSSQKVAIAPGDFPGPPAPGAGNKQSSGLPGRPCGRADPARRSFPPSCGSGFGRDCADVLAEEGAGPGQRGLALVQQRGERLEHVGHAGHHVQGDRDVVAGGPGREPDRVIEEDLVRSGLDQQRRQAGQATLTSLAPPIPPDPTASAVMTGSTSALVLMLSPVPARSAQGDIRTAELGWGRPALGWRPG